MRPHVRRIHRQQLLDIAGHLGVEPECVRHLSKHHVIGAIQRPSVMTLPHRFPWPEISRQVPPRASRAKPPGNPLQNQPVITKPPAPLALMRRHQRLNHRPELVRNHTNPRHQPILAGQQSKNWETRPSSTLLGRCVATVFGVVSGRIGGRMQPFWYVSMSSLNPLWSGCSRPWCGRIGGRPRGFMCAA